MVHDQHTHFRWHALVIFFIFVSCSEPPMGTFSVGSFPMWSGGSLNNFPIPLGVGKLALNR